MPQFACYIGIDPGRHGAVAVLDEVGNLRVLADLLFEDYLLDAPALTRLLGELPPFVAAYA